MCSYPQTDWLPSFFFLGLRVKKGFLIISNWYFLLYKFRPASDNHLLALTRE